MEKVTQQKNFPLMKKMAMKYKATKYNSAKTFFEKDFAEIFDTEFQNVKKYSGELMCISPTSNKKITRWCVNHNETKDPTHYVK